MEEQSEQPGEVPPEPNITIQCGDTIDVDWIRTKVQMATSFLGREQSRVSVRVVDDATMAEMHRERSGVDGTTDVLTFDHGSDDKAIDVDIAVSIDVAKRTSVTRGHSIESELLLYIVHGMLHCMDFDDHDEESHQKIHAEEDRVLQAIGVGAIWSSGS